MDKICNSRGCFEGFFSLVVFFLSLLIFLGGVLVGVGFFACFVF